MPLPSVSVCFPAYNEEETIGTVLEEAQRLLAASGLEYEIVVCDDGSVDRTGSIIDEWAGRLAAVRVVRHARNLGIHAAFERLYAEASKDFVFLNSTDQQWKTSILLEMLPLAGEWDIIVATRKEKHYGLLRRFVSWGFNAVPRILFGTRTFDAGAVKLIRREILQRFALVSRSPFSEAERLIRAARAGYRITEYPVEIRGRQSGRARGADLRLVAQAILDIPRVWYSLRREVKRESKAANLVI
jgi:glycosyltransferase involved in cell wall biosynthesis